jgi:hypothetical protein
MEITTASGKKINADVLKAFVAVNTLSNEFRYLCDQFFVHIENKRKCRIDHHMSLINSKFYELETAMYRLDNELENIDYENIC